MKFYSPSKYFREVFTNNRDGVVGVGIGDGVGDVRAQSAVGALAVGNLANKFASYSTNTVSIKENDELLITCTVNSSKPAADLSLWILRRNLNANRKRRRRRKRSSSSSNSEISILSRKSGKNGPNDAENNEFHENDNEDEENNSGNEVRKLETIDSYVIKNGDLTLKSVTTSKYVVTRFDNHRLVSCVAENANLNEKWETKRILNVLCKNCKKKKRITYKICLLNVTQQINK